MKSGWCYPLLKFCDHLMYICRWFYCTVSTVHYICLGIWARFYMRNMWRTCSQLEGNRQKFSHIKLCIIVITLIFLKSVFSNNEPHLPPLSILPGQSHFLHDIIFPHNVLIFQPLKTVMFTCLTCYPVLCSMCIFCRLNGKATVGRFWATFSFSHK